MEVDGCQSRKRFPESLHFNPGSFRLRSRTESTRSSISSAHIPDSATAYSVSTLASPLSSTYASDIQERFAAYSIDGPGKIRHRHQPSNATTCSTFINDDNELPVHPDFASKLRNLLDDSPQSIDLSETPPINPSPEPWVETHEALSPDEPQDCSYSQRQRQRESVLTVTKSDTTSVASDDISQGDADIVLDYALQLAYGIELEESSVPAEALRPLVAKFINDLGQHIWQAPSDAHTTQTACSSNSSTPFQSGGGGGNGGDGSNLYGKRKKQAAGDDGGDGFSDGEGSGFVSLKRAKPSPQEEETLRLSCPFRKRNPHRFNVRDHHSCAMTYFPKFAELRQHIVKQHKRDAPSAFICDRCTRNFRTRKDLRDHQRQPREYMCDISDHDPEAGIDGPTAIKLVSRKRASGTSADVQWKEIWNILFPDDEDQMIQPFCYTPVIEHFELSAQYLASFEFLQASLRSKMSNPTTLETLAAKFHQCFIESTESCATRARTMPYTNRSNKKNEPARVQGFQGPNPQKPRAAASRPDSGVVLDDGSEGSGSVLGLSALGHRDSVRTVRDLAPRPRGFLASRSAESREIMPAPAAPSMTEDGPLVGPLSSLPLGVTPGGVDPEAAVRAWNSGVTYDQDHLRFSMPPDQWVAAGSLTPHAGYAALDESLLYQTDFSTMGAGFPGFHDR